MGKFVQKDDEQQLGTVHPDLVAIVREAVKRSPFDFICVYGFRSIEIQQQLYAQGRTKPGKVVTMLDGMNKKSRHNYFPSFAVDVVPFDIVRTGKWLETPKTNQQLAQFGALCEQVAKEMGIADYRWGGRFKKPVDRPHHELTRKA